MNSVSIGKKITELREKAGESRQDLADALNLSLSAVAMYEQGNRIPRYEVMIAMKKHFNCTADEIFFANE